MLMTSKMLEKYGPLVLINLPERQDRRSEFAEQLARIDLSYDSPNVQIFPAIRPDEPAGFPTLGARGCFLSHLTVLKEATERAEPSVIFCEDDLDFKPDFLDRLPAVLKALENTNWDIFYGGYTSELSGDVVDEPANVFRVPFDHGFNCTHFYVVKGDVIPVLVSYLEQIMARPAGHPDGGPMHYDGALNRFRADNPNVVTLATLPSLGVQRSSRSDIHNLKWFDRAPVIRDLVGLIRRMT